MTDLVPDYALPSFWPRAGLRRPASAAGIFLRAFLPEAPCWSFHDDD